MNDLIIKQLNYSYRNNHVLKGIILSLSPSEITYILGPNGAGKSTLVNCITGISSDYKGNIDFPESSKMGALLDQPFVYPSLSVQANISIFLRYNQKEYTAYHELLNQYLEVDELLKKRFKKMSQGQRQRVLLFIAMINDPDILLLDEPFNGLDPFYTEKLIALLLLLKKDNRIILINDHIISHTMRLANQIAFLIRHEMVWVMRPEALDNGLYYGEAKKSGSNSNPPRSFAESLREYPPDSSDSTILVTDLTKLYTLAVEHGKTIDI